MYTNYRELQPKCIYIASCIYIYIILQEKIAYVICTDISKYVGIYKLYINTYSLYSYIKHTHTHTHTHTEREREREGEREICKHNAKSGYQINTILKCNISLVYIKTNFIKQPPTSKFIL